MKLESYLLALSMVAGKKNGDRKVPPRHPLQRLWRLYQFSEEIIQLHFYRSEMKPQRIDTIRELIKTWLYMAQRETFLRGTKKCGFYDPLLGKHGGPAQEDESGDFDFSSNQAASSSAVLTDKDEFTGYKSENKHLIPKDIEIFTVRSENPRIRRSTYEREVERTRRAEVENEIEEKIASYKFQLDGDFDDADLDDDVINGDGDVTGLARLERGNPCRGIKQVFIGFKKWSLRYIGNCDGQMTHKHMILRSLKFYNEFAETCETIPPL